MPVVHRQGSESVYNTRQCLFHAGLTSLVVVVSVLGDDGEFGELRTFYLGYLCMLHEIFSSVFTNQP